MLKETYLIEDDQLFEQRGEILQEELSQEINLKKYDLEKIDDKLDNKELDDSYKLESSSNKTYFKHKLAHCIYCVSPSRSIYTPVI